MQIIFIKLKAKIHVSDKAAVTVRRKENLHNNTKAHVVVHRGEKKTKKHKFA